MSASCLSFLHTGPSAFGQFRKCKLTDYRILGVFFRVGGYFWVRFVAGSGLLRLRLRRARHDEWGAALARAR
jgi:hypothetical protein